MDTDSSASIDYSDTEELDEVLVAIRDEEEDFIDIYNPLWFPPGVSLVDSAGSHPSHHCYTHTQHMLHDEVEQVRAAVIYQTQTPRPCDQRMTRHEAVTWVGKLTQYPSYLLLTYGPNDKQDALQQHRGHLVRDIVPPTCLSIADRLNLAELAKLTAQDRHHTLNDAVAPAFAADRPLIKFLINVMPSSYTHPSHMAGWRLPDTHCKEESHPLFAFHHTKRLQANNWCIADDDAIKKAARLENRRENQDLHLVFDLVCAYLLTDPMFDNYDSPKPLKYHCMSEFIPWSMIARHMDTGLFKQCIAPWFQAIHIMHWSLYVKYNLFAPPCEKQFFKTYHDEGVCYTVYPWSLCPYAGRLEFYAGVLTPKLIFEVDLQVRSKRMYTWPNSDFDEMPFALCYPTHHYYTTTDARGINEFIEF
uniref:Uncharacterized protein n=1 Tax=Phoenicopteridae CRESS-DNA-virus sp. TaxID=2815051 RepID=A0A8A4XBM5_9VIRU|nr:MAG: hypothetical protein [Phoenicopteridae CRESS-DNA-virus sp.]